MTTGEVAAYLRLGERKVYALVRDEAIPCVRIGGKLLFPRHSIDLWVHSHLTGDERLADPAPHVLAGSQDPLLEWAVRESASGLALLCNGSGDGVRRLLDGQAMVAGLHLVHKDTGGYNDPVACGLGGLRDLVTIEWAKRTQGLVVAAGNPLGLNGLPDLAAKGTTVAQRQRTAGGDALFHYLLAAAEVPVDTLNIAERPALTEDDLALKVRNGTADCGLAIEAAARRHGLDFIPLHVERFDLAMRRRSYFEPPVQRLLGFARTKAFHDQAVLAGGYDTTATGQVCYNA